MTEKEKRDKRNLAIYRYAMENPLLTYAEIGYEFGIERTTIGDIIRKTHKLLTGSLPARPPKRKSGGVKPKKLIVLGVNLKDPDAEWARLQVRF